MIKICLDFPDSYAFLCKNKNGGYKAIMQGNGMDYLTEGSSPESF